MELKFESLNSTCENQNRYINLYNFEKNQPSDNTAPEVLKWLFSSGRKITYTKNGKAKSSATHTVLDGGSYNIPDNILPMFYDKLAESILQNDCLYFNEMAPKADENDVRLCKLYLDLDIKFSVSGDGIQPLNIEACHFKPLIHQLQNCVNEAFPGIADRERRCIVLTSNSIRQVKNTDNIYKYGIHITWDKICINRQIALSIRRHMIKVLCEKFPDSSFAIEGHDGCRIHIENACVERGGPWVEVIDHNIILNPSMRMPYCFKCNDCDCKEREKREKFTFCPNHPRARLHVHTYYKLYMIFNGNLTEDTRSTSDFLSGDRREFKRLFEWLSLREVSKKETECALSVDHLKGEVDDDDGNGNSNGKKTNSWNVLRYASRAAAFRQLISYFFPKATIKEQTYFYYTGNRGNWRTAYFRVYTSDHECFNRGRVQTDIGKLEGRRHGSAVTYYHVDQWGIHIRCTSQKERLGPIGIRCKDWQHTLKIPYDFYKELFGDNAIPPFGRCDGLIKPVKKPPLRWPNLVGKVVQLNRLGALPFDEQEWWYFYHSICENCRSDPYETALFYRPYPIEEDDDDDDGFVIKDY